MKTHLTLLLVCCFTPLFAQWEVKNFDEMADDKTIHKISFVNDTLGYAMGTRGLVLRSEDAGEHWVNMNTSIEGDIVDFVVSTSGTIILTTRYEEGTFKSTNGIDFDQVSHSENDYPNVASNGDGDFYMSGAEIIYQSVDQGETWNAVYELRQDDFEWGHIKDIEFVNPDTGYAAGEGRDKNGIRFYSFLLKSTDGGDSWTLSNKYEWDSVGIFSSIYFEDETTGFVISNGRTLKTNDGGVTWELLPDMQGAVDLAIVDNEKLITVNRPEAYTEEGPTMFFINESNDGGLTWTNPGFRNGAHLETIHFINDSVGFVAGDYSLILKTKTCGGDIGDGYPWHIFSSVKNESTNLPFSIYPNPTSSRLNLALPLDRQYHYYLTGFNGKIQKQGVLTNRELDISDLPTGYYTITIVGEDKMMTSSFLVLRG